MITATGSLSGSCGMSDRPLSVALFPSGMDGRGEYLGLLRGSLESLGVNLDGAERLTPAWVRAPDLGVDVVHLHWLEYIAPSDRTRWLGAAKTLRRSARLLRMLRTLRERGVAIVWTIHNLAPHEPAHPAIERRLARSVLGLADAAIVNSEHSGTRVAATMGHAEKLNVVPLGNYVDAYPAPVEDRATLRARYGIPDDAFVYLAFGQVRRYKHLPELARAFREVGGTTRLLIAGQPRDESEAPVLRQLAREDERIILDLRRIPTDEVAALHRVSDAAVFAYSEIFSSASLLLALSFGLPSVVPAASSGTEIAVASAIEPVGSAGLVAALRAVQAGDQQQRQAAAFATAQRYDWETVGRETVDLYRRVAAGRS
jgi:glycosyltransferase involved in cell wall biosynthesis